MYEMQENTLIWSIWHHSNHCSYQTMAILYLVWVQVLWPKCRHLTNCLKILSVFLLKKTALIFISVAAFYQLLFHTIFHVQQIVGL